MSAPVALHVNGGGITVQVDASETPLLHVLRENLGLDRVPPAGDDAVPAAVDADAGGAALPGPGCRGGQPGKVRPTRMFLPHDCGQVINPDGSRTWLVPGSQGSAPPGTGLAYL